MRNLSGGSAGALAFGTLLEMMGTLHSIQYQPDIFETIVRLASSMYLLLSAQIGASDEEIAWKNIEATYPVVSYAISSGDLSGLSNVWLQFQNLNASLVTCHSAPGPSPKVSLNPELLSNVDSSRESPLSLRRPLLNIPGSFQLDPQTWGSNRIIRSDAEPPSYPTSPRVSECPRYTPEALDRNWMATRHLVLTWDKKTVQEWLSSIGYGQYNGNIIEHEISGDVLTRLNFETLHDIGITSASDRLDILQAIYNLKLKHNILIEADDYVPVSEAGKDVVTESTPLERIVQMITNKDQRIQHLGQENQRLQQSLLQLEEWVTKSVALNANGLSKLEWASYSKPSLSSATVAPALGTTPQNAPPASLTMRRGRLTLTLKPSEATENTKSVLDAYYSSLNPYSSEDKGNLPTSQTTIGASTSTKDAEQPPGEDRSSGFSSFKVSLDDPCSKVLPAALKKYKITDDWRLYALFICNGTTERCVSLDEKPFILFKRLKDANKNPVFMLRHIRDIPSPITVARRKAEKKAKEPDTSADSNQAMEAVNAQSSGDTRLHQTPAAILQSGSVSDSALKADESHEEGGSRMPSESGYEGSGHQTGNGHGHTNDVKIWTGRSYAVAIYPYEAAYEDEFDITVGEMFVILHRSKGWWQVQRDPSGAGAIDEDARRAWVPAGCLLETNVPPASAIANAAMVSNGQPNPPTDAMSMALIATGQLPTPDAPILPSSFTNTRYPGIALMDRLPQGDHELELVKDDALCMFKRYNHWSYVVKESGKRGWVPSWMIGKVLSSGIAVKLE
ncbi:Adaptor for signal transduction [Tulasnella sp. JGI-2019a]|nr:Adaptor for signal transduction [Tulasnella sp. JGI-2019a]